jgi:hypothetical protein
MGVDPATLMLIAGGAQAAGQLGGAGMGFMGGNAAAQAGRRAETAARQQARAEMEAAVLQQQDLRQEAQESLGATRAGAAESGVGMSGSVLDQYRQAVRRAAEDEARLRTEAARRKQATEYAGALERASGRQAQWRGRVGLPLGLLGGGGQAAKGYGQYLMLS